MRFRRFIEGYGLDAMIVMLFVLAEIEPPGEADA